jgi:hypothetical protein
MKINQKQPKLTKREFYILSALAENEIKEWTAFLNNLNNEYKATKGRKTNTRGSKVSK